MQILNTIKHNNCIADNNNKIEFNLEDKKIDCTYALN